MVTSELGACEWFVWDLRRSNLLDRGKLDQIVGEFLEKNPRAEPPALAEYLVNQGVLSQFQADRLLQGKTQGFVLGPFTLMDALGSGSMGTVYKAQSKTDNRWYAVKVLPRRSMWNVRIARRKVRAFEQCRHPSVVPFVDVGTSGGMHYLAWPLVEGETLDQFVRRNGRLSPSEAALIALQTAEGLDNCHQQNLIHGLLKPSNLMIGPENQVWILDFGIGCLLAETEGESLVDTMSTANSVASGLDCSSPESIMDPTNLTAAGDQYSLGCVLYFCLTGQYPFPEGSAAEKMMAHQLKQPEPLRNLCPEASAQLVEIVERLMQKTPEARYASTAEVVQALRPLAPSIPLPARPVVRPAPAREAPQDNGHPIAPPASETPRSVTSAAAPARAIPTNGGLPSRQTLRGTAAPATPEATPVAEEPRSRERVIPGAVDDSAVGRSWEERLGPLGITIGAIIACGLAWLIAARLF
jgi:serine/threonine-protein kinase